MRCRNLNPLVLPHRDEVLGTHNHEMESEGTLLAFQHFMFLQMIFFLFKTNF